LNVPFSKLTPEEQIKDLDMMEALWKTENPGKELPNSFKEARTTINQGKVSSKPSQNDNQLKP
ncbi:MAG: hypothetical protein HN509_16730, partial [Halobacteriovoraceae bacterium]|nr:hypothetical protein [Halobacteriovoraceae bacterium]